VCDMLQLHANQEDEVVAGLGSADAAAGTATSKPHITHVPHVLQYFRWHALEARPMPAHHIHEPRNLAPQCESCPI